ncbi:MAG: T9SS type A sorting domain-containing protein [Ferruginibacter sp.]
MKKNLYISLITLGLVFSSFLNKAFAQNPTIYASLGSGAWATLATWETFTGNATNTPGAQGTGTLATSVPSGTHHIYIRNGHTVTMGASKNCMGVTIEPTGTLLAGGAFTLKVATGGTGFLGPNDVTITNNGTFGQAADAMVIEVPITARNVTITGSGATNVARLRVVGNNPYTTTITIDQNMTFTQSANYALTACYNPSATDNNTITINAGKTVTLSNASGYFHNNSVGSGTGFGTYTYNINGTLDLTASTQTSTNLTAISPTGGTVNLNINGTLKTGAGFNSSPVAPGVANINVAAGVTVDASLATTMNFAGSAFVMGSGTSALSRTISATGSTQNFPIATALNTSNNVGINRFNAAPPTSYKFGVQNFVTAGFTGPGTTPQYVQKQWSDTMSAFATNLNDTFRFSWVTADQGASFDPAAAVFVVYRTNIGLLRSPTSFSSRPATVSGTGTVADPYVAKVQGVTFDDPTTIFYVSNAQVIPLTLISFNASYNGQQVALKWSTENEINSKNFVIERSADGRNFSALGTVNANNSQTTNNYSFTDAAVLSGASFYRLKIVDKDGQFKYSNIISINTKLKGGVTVYPNPSTANITVSHDKAAANSTLQIMSSEGKIYMSSVIAKDATQTSVDISKLVPGHYVILVNNGTDRTSIKFVKE